VKLPPLIRRDDKALVCIKCWRRWRCPDADELLELNFEYLLEHALGHIRDHRKRKPQHELNGSKRKPPFDWGLP
jgi:hypothetical protein